MISRPSPFRPPQVAAWLVELFIPCEHAESIPGDPVEEFSRDRVEIGTHLRSPMVLAAEHKDYRAACESWVSRRAFVDHKHHGWWILAVQIWLVTAREADRRGS
jgi:hypothetical protein